MITETCQRWTLGREHRRPAGETIRSAAYDVAPIAIAAEASGFVKLHHYAATSSSTAHRFGLYLRGELAGVALFGPPASTNAHRAVFPGLAYAEAVTLGRLVLLDAVPGNGESWFVGRCFALLRARGVVAVESCSDPWPRTSSSGAVVFRGHLGIVYPTLRLLPDGTVLSNRAAGKLVRGERGRGHPVAQLEAWGAPPLRAGEDALAWLRCWRERLTRPMRHRGNHRYLWCLDRRRRREVLRAPRLPYPKWSAP